MNDDLKDEEFVDMKCGCGKIGVYEINGKFSCNKYMRCPTYEELDAELRKCRMELHEADSKLRTIAGARDIINELD